MSEHQIIHTAPDGSDHAPCLSKGDLGEFKRKLDKVLDKRGLKQKTRLKYGKQAKGK